MTLPYERTRSTQQVREFLRDLLFTDVTPRVPREIRQRARSLLKHYPSSFDLSVSHEKLPNIWGPASEEEDYVLKKLKESRERDKK